MHTDIVKFLGGRALKSTVDCRAVEFYSLPVTIFQITQHYAAHRGEAAVPATDLGKQN